MTIRSFLCECVNRTSLLVHLTSASKAQVTMGSAPGAVAGGMDKRRREEGELENSATTL